ncbi:alpha/beta hydrolase [Lutibacter maritimus]|uniref:Acetyl esterase/lipase n=1 Tax=Lutibacter maritimus TaxID=593133 RepID=A0A1I6R1K7_9FLAO|nr:alpha/beta hydrolase [Lutibacter maritimus]SFS58398.1 Acetyl esterase/lipase [Lutibacter maritimus]
MKSNFKIVEFLWLIFNLGNIGLFYAQNQTIPLWSGEIPNAKIVTNYNEIKVFKDSIFYSTSNVTLPTISVFLPKEVKSNGTSIVICPGGGYSHLAIDKEGFKVAKWLNKLGITAFVLKYRLPNDLIMKNKIVGPLQDAQEAIRYVRRNAIKWNLNSEKIGIMGFSAGGHLASTLSTHYMDKVYDVTDTVSAKPNFSILIYPVISMNSKITHKGSRNNLLGEKPTNALIEKYSNELQVNSNTPKTFLIHATDDKVVPVENSINYYLALKNNQVSAELHLFENGGHGFGLGVEETSKGWTTLLQNWLVFNNL